MRDEKIAQMHNAQAKNIASLYQSLLQMDARFIALEKSLFEGRGMWIALFFPERFKKLFEAIHTATLEHHQKLMEQEAKKIDDERKKPKISLLKP